MEFQPYYLPWTESASCRSVGTDVFYPEIGETTWMQARRVCWACPVLAACRDWVMSTELGQDHKTRFGVTAGMSPVERKKYEPEWLAGQESAA
jgi:hypothetical protein